MDEKLMKQIVEAVMQELMAQRSNASACTEGLDKLLVISHIPRGHLIGLIILQM